MSAVIPAITFFLAGWEMRCRITYSAFADERWLLGSSVSPGILQSVPGGAFSTKSVFWRQNSVQMEERVPWFYSTVRWLKITQVVCVVNKSCLLSRLSTQEYPQQSSKSANSKVDQSAYVQIHVWAAENQIWATSAKLSEQVLSQQGLSLEMGHFSWIESPLKDIISGAQ